MLRSAVLAVSSIRDAAEFYGRILGLETKMVGDVLCVGDCVLRLVEGEARHPEGSYVYHVALRLRDRRALGAVLKRVLEFEEVVDGFADHLVSESIYVRDFDGIGVELYVDKPKEAWPRMPDGGVAMDTLPLDVKSLLREAGGAPGEVELGHIHMRTIDVEKAEKFYGAIGFKTTYRWRGAVFMACGDYHHHLAFNSWPLPQPRRGRGLLEIHLGMEICAVDPLGVKIVGRL
ncbi:VOC family protein [Pyrobaculum ferrireducens]|uniref:VOC family protein n=1 Tax=Pyrobaculum ferrireducens TaxID=1104324 RepID=UPI000B125E9D|nr:VOC family protein [Pyrobaculum ferrireducens]